MYEVAEFIVMWVIPGFGYLAGLACLVVFAAQFVRVLQIAREAGSWSLLLAYAALSRVSILLIGVWGLCLSMGWSRRLLAGSVLLDERVFDMALLFLGVLLVLDLTVLRLRGWRRG